MESLVAPPTSVTAQKINSISVLLGWKILISEQKVSTMTISELITLLLRNIFTLIQTGQLVWQKAKSVGQNSKKVTIQNALVTVQMLDLNGSQKIKGSMASETIYAASWTALLWWIKNVTELKMKIVNRLSIGSRAPNLFQAFYFFRRGHPSYRSPIQVHGYLQPYSYAFATSFHMSIEVITSNSFGNALNIG